MIIPMRVSPELRPVAVARGKTVGSTFLAHRPCPVCDKPLGVNSRVTLILVGRDPQDERRGWTAATVAVHDDCADQDEERVNER